MLKYCKIIDEEKGLVQLGAGCDDVFYSAIGMTQHEVEQSEKDNQWYLADKCPHYTEEEIAEMEQQRIASLALTKREVFLALYHDKGITPEQLRSQITTTEALIEFDYAERYYRGNPLINLIGATLGYSEEDLDYLFENKELPQNN